MLALPHKVTAAKVPELLATNVKIVDMSGDFRLRDAREYSAWYGGEHPAPHLLQRAVYGLPELHRDAVQRCLRNTIAGCPAIGAILELAAAARDIDDTRRRALFQQRRERLRRQARRWRSGARRFGYARYRANSNLVFLGGAMGKPLFPRLHPNGGRVLRDRSGARQ